MTDTAKVPRKAEGGKSARRPLVDDDLADQRRSAFQGGTVSSAFPAGEYVHRLRWLRSVPGRVQDGGGTVRCTWTQLDSMAHDPGPAAR